MDTGYKPTPAGVSNPINARDQLLASYPDPSSRELTVVFDNSGNQPYSIEMVAISGQKVITPIIQSQTGVKLNISSLSSGLYIVKVSCGNLNGVAKFVKID